jgi:hypothetical protein
MLETIHVNLKSSLPVVLGHFFLKSYLKSYLNAYVIHLGYANSPATSICWIIFFARKLFCFVGKTNNSNSADAASLLLLGT